MPEGLSPFAAVGARGIRWGKPGGGSELSGLNPRRASLGFFMSGLEADRFRMFASGQLPE